MSSRSSHNRFFIKPRCFGAFRLPSNIWSPQSLSFHISTQMFRENPPRFLCSLTICRFSTGQLCLLLLLNMLINTGKIAFVMLWSSLTFFCREFCTHVVDATGLGLCLCSKWKTLYVILHIKNTQRNHQNPHSFPLLVNLGNFFDRRRFALCSVALMMPEDRNSKVTPLLLTIPYTRSRHIWG